MDMAVDKTRNRIAPLRINLRLAVIFSYACNLPAAECDIALCKFPGKHIQHLTVFNDRIRRNFP